jgi:hypothetical protein
MSEGGNPNGYPTRDWLTLTGAQALAADIRAFWARRGNTPDVWVEQMRHGPDETRAYVVRSNMVNGRPQAQQVAVRV